MPLVSKILESGLLSVFKAQDGLSASDAAQKWAKAYADYAQMAMAGGIPGVLTGAEAKGLESKLYGVLSSPKSATAGTIALAWATGVVSFWSAPPVSFGPGKVIVAALALPIITPGLTAVFSNTKNSPDSCAAQMASTLDTATKTVIVLMPVPPPPHPLPLT